MAVDEGPFQNFVSVHWGGDEWYVATRVDAGASGDSALTLAPYPPGRVIDSATEAQRIFTGKDSGAVLDTRNLPANTGDLFVVPPFSAPPCTFTVVNGYDLDGNAITSLPARAYSISVNQVTEIAWPSRTWSGSQCDRNSDSPLLGEGFILGERVTASTGV